MNLLRALIPSWRFFDGSGIVTDLQFRVSPRDGRDFGPWRSALPNEPTRSFGGLFFNPGGNLRLACLSLIERLLEEEGEVTKESSSYRLVENLIRYRLRQSEAGRESGARFQFKITSGGDDALVSLEHSI